jgi:hypothetical protein
MWAAMEGGWGDLPSPGPLASTSDGLLSLALAGPEWCQQRSYSGISGDGSVLIIMAIKTR